MAGHSFFNFLKEDVLFLDTYTLLASVILVILNTLIVYFVTNNFCGFKASVALKKIRIIPTICILAAYTLFYILTLFFLPLRIQHNLNFLPLLILTWLFVEKRKVSFSIDEIALIWLHIYAIVHLFIAIPFITTLFIAGTLINAALTFIIAAITTIFLCQKLDFNRFLVFVLRRITLRLLIFLTVMLYRVISTILNPQEAFVEDSLLNLVLFIPALIGLIYTLRLTHQSTAVVPDAYHDAKKLLMLLDIKAEEATDFSDLNAMLAHSVELMNLQLPDANLPDSNSADACFEKFIIRTIESIKADRKTNTQVIPNIQFSDKHHEVNDIKIAYMVGLLFEHALETLTKRPIFVDVSLAEHNALIRVSCEYKFEKRLKNLENFLFDNEAISSKIKKNFNLSKLKSLVDTHNGELIITREKNTQEQVDYLSICITFNGDGDSCG